MNRKLRHFNKGYLLIEAMVALALLSICLFLYQGQQLQLVKGSQQYYQELQMIRILSEEVRKYRLEQGKLPQTPLEQSGYQIIFQEKPLEAKIRQATIEVVIKRET